MTFCGELGNMMDAGFGAVVEGFCQVAGNRFGPDLFIDRVIPDVDQVNRLFVGKLEEHSV